MSRLKKFDQYMTEQDQHRVESERDIVIQNQIDDLNSTEGEPTSTIDSVELSPTDLDKLRNVNNIHENTINEGSENIFKFKGKNSDYLDTLSSKLDISYEKIGDNKVLFSKNGHEISVKLGKGRFFIRPSYYGSYYEEENEVRDLEDYLSNYDFDSNPKVTHKYSSSDIDNKNESLKHLKKFNED